MVFCQVWGQAKWALHPCYPERRVRSRENGGRDAEKPRADSVRLILLALPIRLGRVPPPNSIAPPSPTLALAAYRVSKGGRARLKEHRRRSPFHTAIVHCSFGDGRTLAGEKDDPTAQDPATMRQTWVTTKQITKPMPSGSNAETAVHLALRVSFQIV